MLPKITIQGRLAADPELKFNPNGKAVCRLRLVTSDQRKNEQSGKWEDTDTLWISATCWDKLAENVAESTGKGDLVVVTGRLKTDEWNDQAGNKRSAITLAIDTVAADLRFRTLPHGGAGHAALAESKGIPAQEDPWAAHGDATNPTQDRVAPPF